MPVWNIYKISIRVYIRRLLHLETMPLPPVAPPASAEQYCSTSASVFVPTTYLVLVLLKQVPTTSSCITQYRRTITSRRRGNKSESQIFVFVFRRFAETNLFSELSFLFFASALLHLRVRASARPSLSLHYSVHSSIRAENGEICGNECIR